MAATDVHTQPDTKGLGNNKRVTWAASKSQRTKALPKHSLFGTPMEVLDKRELEHARSLDVKQYQKDKEAKKKTTHLPDELKSQVRGRATYETSKQNVDHLRYSLKGVDDEIELKQQKALAFSGDPGSPSQENVHDKSHQWFTTKDLEHSNEINRVGLNQRSYNFDKYGKKPPVHTYSLIGDVLRPGMDLNLNQNFNTPVATPPLYGRRARPPQHPMLHTPPNSEESQDYHPQIWLPPNIRHTFGSRVCDALLADREKAQRTLEEQTFRLRGMPGTRRRDSAPAMEREMNVNYEWLSNAMRQNVCPGYTMNHKQSTTKTVYTDDVFQKRLPDPDEFRYQRDELSKWAEHNVLRERMKKAWDTYDDKK